jgi:hypothetical protein
MIWFVALAVLLTGNVLIGVTPNVDYSVRGCGTVTFSESDSLGILWFDTGCDIGTVFVSPIGGESIRFQCFDREGE